MTIIVATNDFIAADRTVVVFNGGVESVTHGAKVHTSSCGRIAIAGSGNMLDTEFADSVLHHFMGCFMTVTGEHLASTGSTDKDASDSLSIEATCRTIFRLQDEAIYVLSHHRLYTIAVESLDGGVSFRYTVRTSDDPVFFAGTGENYAATVWFHTKNLDEMFKVTEECDYLCGGGYDVIRATDLKPLPKKYMVV